MIFIANNKASETNKRAEQQAKSNGFISKVTDLPPATFDKVGLPDGISAPQPISGSAIRLKNGKPDILYVGAEFCPYCAMQRWPLVIALSRFGTFTNLAGAVSSPNEGQLSNIQTLTFLKSSYTSKYVSFTPYETSDRMGNPLQTLSADDESLVKKENKNGGIPWINYGGLSQGGASYDGSILVGKTNTQIASQIANTETDISKRVIGSANVITAQLCKLTDGKPGVVCQSSAALSAAKNLP